MKHTGSTKSAQHRGFTLVELVIVVLILGIIAAIAMPKAFSSINSARTNSTKSSLSVVRSALELYKADIGSYPPDAATLPVALKPYIKGPFPTATMGPNAGNATVGVGVNPPAVISGTAGWAYTVDTGEFYANDASALAW